MKVERLMLTWLGEFSWTASEGLWLDFTCYDFKDLNPQTQSVNGFEESQSTLVNGSVNGTRSPKLHYRNDACMDIMPPNQAKFEVQKRLEIFSHPNFLYITPCLRKKTH